MHGLIKPKTTRVTETLDHSIDSTAGAHGRAHIHRGVSGADAGSTTGYSLIRGSHLRPEII